MNTRLDFYKVSSDTVKCLLNLEESINKSGLEKSLLNLIKLRASQINGCAYCVDMHTKEALKAGESTQRLFAVSVWQETPFFSDQERAALEWTEVLTLLPQTHAPDEAYEQMNKHFSDKETIDLTMAINAINSWNRLAVGFRKLPK